MSLLDGTSRPAPDVILAPADGDGCRAEVRLVVAPSSGRFHAALEGSGPVAVEAGELIGHVVASGHKVPIQVDRTGTLAALLVDHLELVRAGEPLAWFNPATR